MITSTRSAPLFSFNSSADIVFGQSASLTGLYGSIGNSVYNGLVAALHEWNTLPLTVANGPTLGILSYDDMHNAEVALANTDQLVVNDSVFALVGYVGDSSSKAASEQHDLPFVGAFAGGNELRIPFKRNIINIRASYFDETDALVDYLVNFEHIDRFSVFWQNDASGLNSFEGVKNALRNLRIQLFSSEAFEVGVVNITEHLRSLKAKSDKAPEAIILVGHSKALAEFAKEARAIWPGIALAALSYVGPTFGHELRQRGVIDRVFRTQVVDYKSSNPVLSSRYEAAMLALNASAVLNFEAFEGYIVGRVMSQTVARVWSALGSSNFNSNATLAREYFLQSIYYQGILSVDDLRLGPYGDISADCENPGSGCGCNQGMRQVYGSVITTNGTFEAHKQLDASFSQCYRVTANFTLTFGQVAAFSGPGAEIAQNLALGIRAAFAASNAAEELGLMKVELLTEDDQYNPSLTVAKTVKFVEQRVFALISNVGTGTTQSILNYTTSRMIPLISPFTGADIFRKPFNSYVVNLRASYGDEIVSAVLYMIRKMALKNFSIMYQNDSFGRSIVVELDAALRANGLNILSFGPFNRGTVPGVGVVNALSRGSNGLAVEPQAIFLIGTAEPCSQFIVFAKTIWPGCIFVATSVALDQLGPLLKDKFNRSNVYVTQVVPPTDTGLSIVKSYQNELKAFVPNATFGVASLEGYIAGRFVIELLKSFPNTLSREDFISALYPKSLFNVGDIQFNFTNGCNQGARRVYLTTLVEPGGRQVLVSEEGTIAFKNKCTISRPDCYPDRYRSFVHETCQLCPKGWVTRHQQEQQCIPCEVGKRSVYPDSKWPYSDFCIECSGNDFGECWNCEMGQYSNVTGAPHCSVCAPGFFTSKAGSTSCSFCGAGSEFNASSLQTNPTCNLCQPGTYAKVNDVFCAVCPQGRIASDFGQAECQDCPFYMDANFLGTACRDNAFTYLFVVIEFIALSVLSLLFVLSIGARRIPITNISMEASEVMLTTHWGHWVRPRHPCGSKVVSCTMCVSGTGLPCFEKQKLYRVEYRSATTLRIRLGHVEESDIQTSMGSVRVPFPQSLWHVGPFGTRIPVVLMSWFWLGIAITPFCVLEPNMWDAYKIASVTCGSTCVVILVVASHLWSFKKTVYLYSLEFYRLRLRMARPKPSFVPRGPDRAISAATLVAFYRAFVEFIRLRNMYYINTCLVKPLTEPHQMSFAELVGPVQVKWFVSHHWGTPFVHFLESLTHHSESMATEGMINIDPSRIASKGSEFDPDFFVHKAALEDMTYWVCLFSNNQWRVREEVGSSLSDASFCLALKSGFCRGTAMVLDPDALPLTRSWCLCEVFLTFSLTTKDKDFQGLLLCTTAGVLNNGSAGIDVAMNMARRIHGLRLEDASASHVDDKARIEAHMMALPGGLEAINLFVRTVFRTALFAMRRRFQSDFANLVSMLSDSSREQELSDYLTRATCTNSDVVNLLRQASRTLRGQTEGEELTRVRFVHSMTAPPGEWDLRENAEQSKRLEILTAMRVAAISDGESERRPGSKPSAGSSSNTHSKRRESDEALPEQSEPRSQPTSTQGDVLISHEEVCEI